MVSVHYDWKQLFGPTAIGLVAWGQVGNGYCGCLVGLDGGTDASRGAFRVALPKPGLGINQSLNGGNRSALPEFGFGKKAT